MAALTAWRRAHLPFGTLFLRPGGAAVVPAHDPAPIEQQTLAEPGVQHPQVGGEHVIGVQAGQFGVAFRHPALRPVIQAGAGGERQTQRAIGEGAGLLVLEELEHAKARGAKIYAELLGYGASDDAYHMTAPSGDGEGMARAMRNALKDAGIAPEAIGHINAHATSTKLNDATETKAIKAVFGAHASKIKISATKSMTGHLLGASGGIETVFTAQALYHQTVPGTINLTHPDPECDLDYTASGSEQVSFEYAMCNSFGFGGTNASLVLKKWTD